MIHTRVGGNVMEFNFNKKSTNPYLISQDDIVTTVNKEFIEFTGFTMKELLGKPLFYIGNILKFNSQKPLDRICNNYSGYIFSKCLEAIEVNISILHCRKTNQKIYVFVEKPNSRLHNKLRFTAQLFEGNIVGASVFSVPDLILLKTNQKYLDFLDAPYNKIENSLGKPLKEIVTGFVGSKIQENWNSILLTQKNLCIKEFRFDFFNRGLTYWDATYAPVFENGKMKYVFEHITDATERVCKNHSIEQQRKLIELQKEELELQKKDLEQKNKIIEQQKEELKLQITQLITIVKNIPNEIYINYQGGRIFQLNEATRKVIHKTDGLIDLGDSFNNTTYFTLDGKALTLEKTPSYRALKGEIIHNEIIVLKRPNKELILEISATPVYDDAADHVIMSITRVHDITATANANALINKQKGQLEAILDNIHEEIYIIDSNGIYTMLNETARLRQKSNKCRLEKIYDSANMSEYCDLSGERLCTKDLPITRLMKGEAIKDYMMIINDPIKRYVCCNGKPLFDSNGNFSVGIISLRDVTSEILHKQSTERELEMLTKLIKNLDLPVIRMSYPALTIIDVNQKTYKALKTMYPEINSINDIIGKCYSEFIAKLDSEYDVLSHIRTEVEKKKVPYTKQKKCIFSGEEVYMTILYQPIVDNKGEVEELVGIIFDVTSEVKANNSMQNTLKMQEEFFANISHELKTPINVIYSTVQLFNMYCSNGSLDEKKDSIIKYIDSIKQNTYRLSKLVNNIVDISKIESGFFELQISNNNIVELVEDIVMSVADYTDSKGINIIFDTDVEEKIIGCDPEKIERIVLNLISNAIKFSNKDDEIFIALKDQGEFVEISVKDNGIGIEDTHLSMIFDRFKQVDKSLSRNAEGTGIGLSLVKSIVELHDGHIFVESAMGKGSKFTVVLPASKVMQENIMLSNKMRSTRESIQLELSDVSS
jgi:signal transduction histidine kinase